MPAAGNVVSGANVPAAGNVVSGAEFTAMLLADARLPTGGHAHSAGVEPAVLGGLAPGRVRELMIGRAVTASRVEAGAAVVARHVLVSGSGSLAQVAAEWAARTPAPAQRDASAELGRGYLRLGRSLWPSSPHLADAGRLDRPYRPLILGAIAAESGLPATDLARLVIYDEAAGAAAALLKLEPGDPAVATGWILDACAASEPLLGELAALTDPVAIPASGAPQTEEWAQAHTTRDWRLFRA